MYVEEASYEGGTLYWSWFTWFSNLKPFLVVRLNYNDSHCILDGQYSPWYCWPASQSFTRAARERNAVFLFRFLALAVLQVPILLRPTVKSANSRNHLSSAARLMYIYHSTDIERLIIVQRRSVHRSLGSIQLNISNRK